MAEAIKVAVRVRPFNQREKDLKSQLCVKMDGATTSTVGENPKSFTFDYSYWSFDDSAPNFASQDTVMQDIGTVILQNSIQGFNGCLFAYGQTGSGKSYSVMGYKDSPGIIPRSVDAIFEEKKTLEANNSKELRVWISFVEIYNEQVRDLLHAGADITELKVMDHPKLGVYVPGLTEAACCNPDDVQRLMDFGTKKRVTAATQMNATSSRSHAVFTVKVQHLEGAAPEPGKQDQRTALNAKINLVDLAGSERQSKTGAEGATLKEGCAINQSLSSLGLVIKELSEAAGTKKTVPFRASKLTFLLKESLSGNSKTFMIAAISPASDNVEETVSTLRFASSVKKIKLVAKQNKDKKDQLIDSLQEEIKKLKAQMEAGGGSAPADLHDDLQERQRLVEEMNSSYQDQVEKSKEMDKLRSDALADSGLSQDEINASFGVEKDTPFLLNMADDPMLAGCLLYLVPKGKTTSIGNGEDATINLKGQGIPALLCTIENKDNANLVVEKNGKTGRVVLNGKLLQEGQRQTLHHNDKIFLGRAYALKLTVPLDAKGDHDQCLSLEGLEDEWSALEDSPSWCALQMYLEQILRQMAPESAKKLFNEVREGCKMCDEANEITDECRSPDGLRFEVDLTTSIPTSVVVRVWQKDKSAEKQNPDDEWEQLYFWNTHQMAERLERMRDCYEVFSRTGNCEVDELMDPWHEAHPREINQRMLQLEAMLVDMQEHMEMMKHEKETAVNKVVMLWQQDGGGPDLRAVFLAWKTLAVSKHAGKEKAMQQSRSLRRTSSLRAKGPKGDLDGSPATSKSRPEVQAEDDAPAAVPKKPALDQGRSKQAKADAPTPEPKPEGVAKARAKTPAIKKAPIAKGMPSKAGSRVKDEAVPKSQANRGPSEKPAVPKGAPAFNGTTTTTTSTTNETDAVTGANLFVDNTDLGQTTVINDNALPPNEDENGPLETQSLRNELSAAWELCKELQGRLRDQDMKLERHSEELSRWRGVGEDMRMLRHSMDKGEIPNFRKLVASSNPSSVSSPANSRSGSPIRGASAGVTQSQRVLSGPLVTSSMRQVSPTSPRMSPPIPGSGYFPVAPTTSISYHGGDSRIRSHVSPLNRWHTTNVVVKAANNLAQPVMTQSVRDIGMTQSVRDIGTRSPPVPLTARRWAQVVSPAPSMQTMPTVGSINSAPLTFQFSARDDSQGCLSPAPPSGHVRIISHEN